MDFILKLIAQNLKNVWRIVFFPNLPKTFRLVKIINHYFFLNSFEEQYLHLITNLNHSHTKRNYRISKYRTCKSNTGFWYKASQNKLTILTGKNFFFTKFSAKTHWKTMLADSFICLQFNSIILQYWLIRSYVYNLIPSSYNIGWFVHMFTI